MLWRNPIDIQADITVVLVQEGLMWDMVILAQKGCMWHMDTLAQEGCMQKVKKLGIQQSIWNISARRAYAMIVQKGHM